MKTLKNMYKVAGLDYPSNFKLWEMPKIIKNSSKSIELSNEEIFSFDLQMWKKVQDKLQTSEYDQYDEYFSFEEVIENEIIFSSKIEGINLEVLKKEVFESTGEQKIKIKNIEQTKDAQADAFKYLLNQDELNENVMNNLITILSSIPEMSKSKLTGSESNLYRDSDVGIFQNINGVDIKIHSGVHSKKIRRYMNKLYEFINNVALKEKKGHPFHIVTNVAMIHVVFEYVHPYFDGNGRIGRMLVAWYLRKTWFEQTSYFLSEIIQMNKNKYYKSLEHSQKSKLVNFHGIFMFEVMNKSITMYSVLTLILKDHREKINKSLFNFLKKLLILDVDVRELSFTEIKGFFKDFTRQTFYNNINKLTKFGVLDLKKVDNHKFKLNKKYIQK